MPKGGAKESLRRRVGSHWSRSKTSPLVAGRPSPSPSSEMVRILFYFGERKPFPRVRNGKSSMRSLSLRAQSKGT